MSEFTVKMAKLNIAVNCQFDYTKKFCSNYLTDEKADFAVSVNDSEIDEEIANSPYISISLMPE